MPSPPLTIEFFTVDLLAYDNASGKVMVVGRAWINDKKSFVIPANPAFSNAPRLPILIGEAYIVRFRCPSKAPLNGEMKEIARLLFGMLDYDMETSEVTIECMFVGTKDDKLMVTPSTRVPVGKTYKLTLGAPIEIQAKEKDVDVISASPDFS